MASPIFYSILISLLRLCFPVLIDIPFVLFFFQALLYMFLLFFSPRWGWPWQQTLVDYSGHCFIASPFAPVAVAIILLLLSHKGTWLLSMLFPMLWYLLPAMFDLPLSMLLQRQKQVRLFHLNYPTSPLCLFSPWWWYICAYNAPFLAMLSLWDISLHFVLKNITGYKFLLTTSIYKPPCRNKIMKTVAT